MLNFKASAIALPYLSSDFGPTPRTYDAGGHLTSGHHKHQHAIVPSKYDPAVDFPELDYGKASAVHGHKHQAAARKDAGPPVYYAPTPLKTIYGPSGPIEAYLAESSGHYPVKEYLPSGYHQQQHSAPQYQQYQQAPHPYKADGEAQVDVHSTPDGFSYQVIKKWLKGFQKDLCKHISPREQAHALAMHPEKKKRKIPCFCWNYSGPALHT